MPSEFPWDTLKAETLRSLCRDLNLPPRLGRRAEMIKALSAIADEGLEVVLERIDEIVPNETGASSSRRAKRPREAEPQGTLLSDRKKGINLRSGLRADGSLLKKRQKAFDGVVIESAKAETEPRARSVKRRRVAKTRGKKRSTTKATNKQTKNEEEDGRRSDEDGDEDAAGSDTAAGPSTSNVSHVPVSFGEASP
ncbi:hypothetical protein OE88DRAFT_1659673 [Heliocybe sulcata]|uniref:Uncharacterized protein n=1 Tax=Heliocybe sulcata TaxID=5364 RepID=A0A5C3N293_9AGAM|nr:hypothetical protein OE88DRAFT_1659673 [Heliocybe sulcata]